MRTDEMKIRAAVQSLNLRKSALEHDLKARTELREFWQRKVADTTTLADENEAKGYYCLADAQVVYAEREIKFISAVLKELED